MTKRVVYEPGPEDLNDPDIIDGSLELLGKDSWGWPTEEEAEAVYQRGLAFEAARTRDRSAD